METGKYAYAESCRKVKHFNIEVKLATKESQTHKNSETIDGISNARKHTPSMPDITLLIRGTILLLRTMS